MATIYDLKPKFQALLRPIAGRFARAGVTANAVTLAALAMSLLQGALLALLPGTRWPLLLLPLTLFVRMALNAIDGLMAKEHGQKTVRGAVLNELSDVVSDAALYLPFALIAGVSAPLVVLVVVSGTIAEFAGVVGPAIGASRRYDGPFGKSDRAFAFGSIAALLGLGLAPGPWTAVALAGMLGLSAITIWNRARKAIAEAKA